MSEMIFVPSLAPIPSFITAKIRFPTLDAALGYAAGFIEAMHINGKLEGPFMGIHAQPVEAEGETYWNIDNGSGDIFVIHQIENGDFVVEAAL